MLPSSIIQGETCVEIIPNIIACKCENNFDEFFGCLEFRSMGDAEFDDITSEFDIVFKLTNGQGGQSISYRLRIEHEFYVTNTLSSFERSVLRIYDRVGSKWYWFRRSRNPFQLVGCQGGELFSCGLGIDLEFDVMDTPSSFEISLLRVYDRIGLKYR